MAICYDFDGTLAPGNMQEHNFLPALGIGAAEFWTEVKALAKKQDSDEILAYMKLMIEHAHSGGIPVRRNDFLALGAKLDFFPGVRQWFARSRDYAHEKGVRARAFYNFVGPARDDRRHEDSCRVRRDIRLRFHVRRERGTRVACSRGQLHDQDPVSFPHQQGHTRGLRQLGHQRLRAQGRAGHPLREHGLHWGRLDGHTMLPPRKAGRGLLDRRVPERRRRGEGQGRDMVSGGRVNLVAPADYSKDSAIERCVFACIDKVEAVSRIEDAR